MIECQKHGAVVLDEKKIIMELITSFFVIRLEIDVLQEDCCCRFLDIKQYEKLRIQFMYINKPMIKVERVGRQSRPLTEMSLSQKKKTLIQASICWTLFANYKISNPIGPSCSKTATRKSKESKNKRQMLKTMKLLSGEYETQEQKFSKLRRKIKVALQSVEEHIQICENEKKQRAEGIQKLKAEIQQLQSEETTFGKKVKRKNQIRQKIEEYKREIQASSVRLQAAKQKSYEQKNLYLQTQEVQFKLGDSLQKIDDDEKIYYQFRNREEKYRQLSRIVEKLHSKTEGGNQDVQSYLKNKISAMAHLRTSILTLQQKLQQYNTSIEQQQFVIEGLKRRGQQEQEVDDQVYKKYQNKYEKLYFSKNNDIKNWKNYKSYLQELLKRDRVQPHARQQSQTRHPRETFSYYQPDATFNIQRQHSSLSKTPLTKSNYVRKHSNLRTDPDLHLIEQEEDDPRVNDNFRQSRNVTNQNSPIHRFNRQLPNQIPYDSIKLPRLGKAKGKGTLESGKIKQNIKKMMNESDVSLESVNSEDAVSGEFIEVQFHKK